MHWSAENTLLGRVGSSLGFIMVVFWQSGVIPDIGKFSPLDGFLTPMGSLGRPRVSRAAPAGPAEASQVGIGPATPTLPALAWPSFPLHFLCISFVFPLYMQCLPKGDPYFSVFLALLVPEPWLKVTGGTRRTSVPTRRRPARGLWMVG